MPLFKHLILISIVVTSPVAAQDEPIVLETPERESFDYRLFRNVYEYQEPVFSAAMRGVNVASYPAFFVVIPAAGITDYVVDGELGIASRFSVAELATFGVVYGLKHIVRRARPYAALPDVRRRPLGDDQLPGGIDPFSFPSGHSAVAFSIATVASLSHPEWYVITPMMTWASATALARVWHGVHFPSDIAVGAVVGTGVGILVHVLLAPEDDAAASTDVLDIPPAFSFTIGL